MRRAQTTIQFTKQPFREDLGPQKIESIEFSTFSGTDVLKTAEFQMWCDHYYDSNMRPVDNGLLDLRMGPPKPGAFCKTCGGSYVKCPGHWGYLPLALPVYNVGYLNTIVGVLKSICKNCSKILLEEKLREMFLKRMRNPNSEHLKKAEILKAVVRESVKVIYCPRCGYQNGFTKKGSSTIEYRVKDDFTETVKKILDPQMVYQLLKNVQDAILFASDCELLYIKGRPENLVVTNILVPPTVIRPSRMLGNFSMVDDISEKLRLIFLANSALHEQLSKPESQDKILETWGILQYEVAHYINSESSWPLGPFPPDRQTGFAQHIKGKQGRFRSNLCGKRVEYTARTVISPDPNLKVTEVGIPMFVALILTYPERVTHHNIEKLRQRVHNGLSKYPGAKILIPADGIPIALIGHFRRCLADELKYGDIVERHLEDGDIVLFNRQPSLHRMSMMCHRARIMPWRTLRFNESVCNPYNADFDGDEMNLHVPQTE